MPEIRRDITRTFLALLFIGVLIGTSLWILQPFLGAAIWAVTIVVATWPRKVFTWICRRGRTTCLSGV